jgi:hypothetical protein
MLLEGTSMGEIRINSPYKHLSTIPLPAYEDPKYSSHLARQARKFADGVIEYFKTAKPKDESHEWVGYAASVSGDRGSGKSTWINFVKSYLTCPEAPHKDEKDKWIIVRMDLSPLNAATVPRSEALPFYFIYQALYEKFREDGKVKNYLEDLKKCSSQIALRDELAGQAAIAFATDDEDFARLYTELSFEPAKAMKEFVTTLNKLCWKKDLRVLLILDDMDMLVDRNSIKRFIWGSLYLAENAPVCRILSSAPSELHHILVPNHLRSNPVVARGWVLKAIGNEFLLSPMNEIRKMVFLRFPERRNAKEPLNGRIIWAEALNPKKDKIDLSPSLLKKFVDELVSADYYENWGGKESRLPEYRVNNLLTEEAVPKNIEDKDRAKCLANFLSLFPDNRREAVLVTNFLIDQRRQIKNKGYQLPFDLVHTWETFGERLFRVLMCIGYTRWPDSTLGQLLWGRSTELLQAVEDGAITLNRRNRDKVQINPKKGLPIIEEKLVRLRKELGLEPKSPSELLPGDIILQHTLLTTICDLGPKKMRKADGKYTQDGASRLIKKRPISVE